ncbi:MAG: hypothetical protein ACJARF_002355, partial [Alteromonadaceae bacterium]
MLVVPIRRIVFIGSICRIDVYLSTAVFTIL